MSSVEQQIPLRVRVDDEAQLKNFYTEKDSNADLLSYLRQARPEVLYLYGKPHTGISHLLLALIRQAQSQQEIAQYLPLKEFSDASINGLEYLEQCQLLCVDDIEQVSAKNEWQVQVLHLFNRIRQQGGRVVFAGHKSPSNLQIDLADLRSRILSGQTWMVTEMSDPQKLSALKMRASSRGFTLSDQVTNYLLGRQQRDMTTLMQRLDQLDHLSLQEKKLITVPLVKKLIESGMIKE